jgi:hypothetical protein
MFDEPEEERSGEKAADPKQRAQEKADEFRMFAELAAVFEGTRKFDAAIYPDLSADVARDVQKTIAKLEKARHNLAPILHEAADLTEAARLLDLYHTADLSTNNYHVYRRPGEVMVLRWLAGDEVETYYQRLQAHFDAAMAGHKEDHRQATEWKQDAAAKSYGEALDKIEMKLAERYLRDPIRKLGAVVLSTQSADELNISFLADYIMQVPATEIVGEASAPPEDATDQERAWFFKLFSLRGMKDGQERMLFFAFLQKADDEW